MRPTIKFAIVLVFVVCSCSLAFSQEDKASGDNKTPLRFSTSPKFPVYRSGPGVTPPVAVHTPDAEYPESARNSNIEGKVVLQAVVKNDGTVAEVTVSRSLSPDLDRSAISAVRKWKFRPATKDGVPVAFSLMVEVNFRLK